jgi:hypothetical protein
VKQKAGRLPADPNLPVDAHVRTRLVEGSRADARIFGCGAEDRRLGEASGGGSCGEERSSKQADKRPPVEPRSPSKRSAEMPARRAEAR